MFQRLDSVSIFRWKLLIWAQSTELLTASGPETETSSINWPNWVGKTRIYSVDFAQMGRYHLEMGTASIFRNVVFEIKYITLDSIQNYDSYINIPLLQTIDNINMLGS
jgi:hypothetical protein